jgi:uncharacterized protein (TIGR03435 family)
MDDSLCLRDYVEQHADEAFGMLVTRHVSLVYSVALRQTGNPHDAEEITQAVFIILAQKAAQLRHEQALSSWLFQATRLTAANFVRGKLRRQHREQEAFMQTLSETSVDPVWPQISPMLDTAVAALRETDRRAILLRFYEGRNLREVGLALGASEAAAEKRVGRALEKLRKFFSKRGVTSTTAILAGAMSAHSVHAAPAGLAHSVALGAAANGAAAGGSTLTLVKSALKLMAWTKVKTAVTAGILVLLAAGTTITTIKSMQTWRMYAWRSHGITRAEINNLSRWPPQVWVAPATAKNTLNGNQLGKNEAGQLMGRNMPFPFLLRDAYGLTELRMILKLDPPSGTYDFMANLPQGSAEALQTAINQTFGVVVKHETIVTNVLVLRVGDHGLRGFSAPVTNQWGATERFGTDTATFLNQPLATMDVFLEDLLKIPIIDQTGLTGRHEFSIKWKPEWWKNDRDNLPGLQAVLSDQLGLELVPTNMPIEMLVVEKVR